MTFNHARLVFAVFIMGLPISASAQSAICADCARRDSNVAEGVVVMDRKIIPTNPTLAPQTPAPEPPLPTAPIPPPVAPIPPVQVPPPISPIPAPQPKEPKAGGVIAPPAIHDKEFMIEPSRDDTPVVQPPLETEAKS